MVSGASFTFAVVLADWYSFCILLSGWYKHVTDKYSPTM